MVAKSSSFLFAITLLLITIDSAAQQITANSILQEAKNNVLIAQINLDTAINKCRGSLNVVDVKHIKHIKASKSEMFTALFFLSDKAIMECESKSWGGYLFHLNILRAIERELGSPVTEQTDQEVLLLGNSTRRVQLKLEYMLIDENKRKLLEDVKQLLIPFDAVLTARMLGI